jgi:hypothetical protein
MHGVAQHSLYYSIPEPFLLGESLSLKGPFKKINKFTAREVLHYRNMCHFLSECPWKIKTRGSLVLGDFAGSV